jgi:hypothetical protein
MDLPDSPAADDCIDKAPFAFEGTPKRLHFTYLLVEQPALTPSPDHD